MKTTEKVLEGSFLPKQDIKMLGLDPFEVQLILAERKHIHVSTSKIGHHRYFWTGGLGEEYICAEVGKPNPTCAVKSERIPYGLTPHQAARKLINEG